MSTTLNKELRVKRLHIKISSYNNKYISSLNWLQTFFFPNVILRIWIVIRYPFLRVPLIKQKTLILLLQFLLLPFIEVRFETLCSNLDIMLISCIMMYRTYNFYVFLYIYICVWDEFRGTKRVIRRRNSNKERQHNGQKKKYKKTSNDLQNTTQTMKDRTRNQLLSIFFFREVDRVCWLFILTTFLFNLNLIFCLTVWFTTSSDVLLLISTNMSF